MHPLEEGGDTLERKTLITAFAVLVAVTIIAAMAIQGAQSATTTRNDPLTQYRYRVEIDGITIASFEEVEGLNVTVEVIEYREGSDISSAPILLPGLTRYGPLVLRNGITANAELWAWMEEVIDGDIESARRSMSVIIQDPKGTDLVRYNLQEAWPSNYSVKGLDGMGTTTAIEELTVQYEKFERETD